ncbi:hypothetical protein GQ42DRAFT_165751 [Ramicandelaber brevisporus]|nr:hypothetical protein GQ42DRAFT_165751 [Ramicandelaber brevisporus]
MTAAAVASVIATATATTALSKSVVSSSSNAATEARSLFRKMWRALPPVFNDQQTRMMRISRNMVRRGFDGSLDKASRVYSAEYAQALKAPARRYSASSAKESLIRSGSQAPATSASVASGSEAASPVDATSNANTNSVQKNAIETARRKMHQFFEGERVAGNRTLEFIKRGTEGDPNDRKRALYNQERAVLWNICLMETRRQKYADSPPRFKKRDRLHRHQKLIKEVNEEFDETISRLNAMYNLRLAI